MVSAREGRRTRAFPLYAVVLAIGVLLVVLLVGWLAWIDAQASHDKALRTSRVYGAHVESVLGDLFHKTDILEAIVVTQDGELSEETFLSLAESLGEGIGIRSIQCLPGGVVRYLHPLAGNEAVLGDNVFSDPYRKVDAQLAVDTKSITLSGPYELTQGGIGLIARNPVFLQDETGEDEFWGFTSFSTCPTPSSRWGSPSWRPKGTATSCSPHPKKAIAWWWTHLRSPPRRMPRSTTCPCQTTHGS